MHESIVALLNRRFVCTYFDVYPGPGHDDAGLAFAQNAAREAGRSLRYGALVTPDGEFLDSFGFAQDGVVTALRETLAQYPEWNAPTAEEAAALAAAPDDVAGQLRAARIECELLQHDRARARLERLAASDLGDADRSRVAFAHAHAGVTDLGLRDLVALRKELDALDALPDDLRDDQLADLVSLDLELAPGAFFGGWRLRAGVDAAATADRISAELARSPGSNRAGELRFQLGLCRVAQGDLDAADEVFAAHARELPDDRYALLSRLQHRSYSFHPTERPPIGGSLSDPAVASTLRKLSASGKELKIMTQDGRELSGDEAQQYLRRFLDRTPPPAQGKR